MKKGFGRFMNFLARRNQSGARGTPPPPPRCPFPNCGKPVFPLPGKPDVCDDHRKLIGDVTFIMAHLRTTEAPKKSDIIIPGGIVRRPGMKGG